MSLQSQLAAAVATAQAYVAKLSAYINGPASGDGSTVTVDTVTLKTLARQQAEHDAAVVSGVTGPAAWGTPAAWVTAMAYTATAPRSVVTQGGNTYVCLTAHTSGTFATDLAAAKWLLVAQKGDVGAAGSAGANGSNGVDGLSSPGGRLTLTSGVPVLTGAVSGAGTVYYALHNHNRLPIYDGSSAFAATAFTELSNVLGNSSSTKAGPAAAVANACYDIYGWSDSGTLRLTRSDFWKKAGATVTMTIASPCVVTHTGHGLTADFDYEPVVFTTTGALPTGITAGTVYFIKYVSANTYNLYTSPGGSVVNTSGSQSGTHTATVGDRAGTTALAASGNCERQRVLGLLTNKNAITNGPGANLGTFLGTIRTNSSGTVDWLVGGTAPGGSPISIGLWNRFNRVLLYFTSLDSTSSWVYSSSTFRPANNSTSNRISFVQGLAEDFADSEWMVYAAGSSTSVYGYSGLNFNSTTVSVTPSGRSTLVGLATATSSISPGSCRFSVQQLGWGFIQPVESGAASTLTWYGLGIGVQGNGLSFSGRF